MVYREIWRKIRNDVMNGVITEPISMKCQYNPLNLISSTSLKFRQHLFHSLRYKQQKLDRHIETFLDSGRISENLHTWSSFWSFSRDSLSRSLSRSLSLSLSCSLFLLPLLCKVRKQSRYIYLFRSTNYEWRIRIKDSNIHNKIYCWEIDIYFSSIRLE